MAEKAHRMEKLSIITPLHYLPVPSHYGFVLFVRISHLAFFSWVKRQRISPTVPIAAADETTKTAELRSKFRHGSKPIRTQGYQMVFLAARSMQSNRLLQVLRAAVLCTLFGRVTVNNRMPRRRWPLEVRHLRH